MAISLASALQGPPPRASQKPPPRRLLRKQSAVKLPMRPRKNDRYRLRVWPYSLLQRSSSRPASIHQRERRRAGRPPSQGSARQAAQITLGAGGGTTFASSPPRVHRKNRGRNVRQSLDAKRSQL